MLAQTQTARVAERFPAVLARFPDAASMAAAAPGDVIRAWVGLGYNRRALALHQAASGIVERHGARVPDELEPLLALPGVGPYTARAVLAFGHRRDVGVVDTNVGRVLARAVAGRRLSPREAQDLADDLVPAGGGRDWNLMVMDFGSLVCRARAPRCGSCPLSAEHVCRWYGTPHEDPAVGSAGTSSRQGRFAGSDRQLRGRLMRAACEGPLERSALAALAGRSDASERIAGVAAALVQEGMLVETANGCLALP